MLPAGLCQDPIAGLPGADLDLASAGLPVRPGQGEQVGLQAQLPCEVQGSGSFPAAGWAQAVVDHEDVQAGVLQGLGGYGRCGACSCKYKCEAVQHRSWYPACGD